MTLLQKQPQYNTYEDFPVNDLLLYAGLDCIATSEVLAKTWPTIVAQPEYTEYNHGTPKKVPIMSISDSMEQYTMPFFNFICDMEINGIKYDVERNVAIGNRMMEEVGVLEDRIFTAIGERLDLNSGKVMREYLYEEEGFTPPFTTKHGEPSTDSEAMKQLAKTTGHIWLLDIGRRNDIVSAYRTFIENYVRDHLKSDGRIHPSYNLNGTSSFRITGDNPNLKLLRLHREICVE